MPSDKHNQHAGPQNQRPEEQQQRSIGMTMTFIAWIVLFVLLAIYFTREESQRFNPNQNPESQSMNGQTTLVLQANAQNHFVVSGRVNGNKVNFLLDTGATYVAVPEKMAAKLGLIKGQRGYANTANGKAVSYNTQIEKLQFGDIVLYDVTANISPGMNSMNEILLGMSALSQLEFSQKNGQLYLVQ